jgi:hypothetical protein
MHLIRIFVLILATTSIAHAGGQPVYHRGPVRTSGDPPAAAGYPFVAAPVVLLSPTMIYRYAVRPFYLVAPSAKNPSRPQRRLKQSKPWVSGRATHWLKVNNPKVDRLMTLTISPFFRGDFICV